MYQIINDMANAKLDLQSNGIGYIDWKLDNMGFSSKDNVYKLFDFDSSGIISNNYKEWTKPPPHRWIYKRAFEKGLSFPLDIDDYCFDMFCKELKEEIKLKRVENLKKARAARKAKVS
jgi:hypothetical protein